MSEDAERRRLTGNVPAGLYEELKDLCRKKKKKLNVMLQIGLKSWLDER